MEPAEAAEALRCMATSIRESPDQQFTYTIKVIGVQAMGQGGGTGLSISTTGGGPGSTTIGMQVSGLSGNSSAEIVHTAANDAAGVQMTGIVEALTVMADEVEAADPDPSRIQHAMAMMRTRIAPDLMLNVAANLVTAALPHLHL